MKILLYGFGPYKQFRENISEKIINQVQDANNLVKIVFPVKFKPRIFLRAIKKFKPEIILGIGQAPSGGEISVEKKTKNVVRNKDGFLKKINPRGPKSYPLNLNLKEDRETVISDNAGKYICNFSIYIISGFILDKNIKLGFLRIPRDYDLNKAVNYINSLIIQISKDNLTSNI